MRTTTLWPAFSSSFETTILWPAFSLSFQTTSLWPAFGSSLETTTLRARLWRRLPVLHLVNGDLVKGEDFLSSSLSMKKTHCHPARLWRRVAAFQFVNGDDSPSSSLSMEKIPCPPARLWRRPPVPQLVYGEGSSAPLRGDSLSFRLPMEKTPVLQLFYGKWSLSSGPSMNLFLCPLPLLYIRLSALQLVHGGDSLFTSSFTPVL